MAIEVYQTLPDPSYPAGFAHEAGEAASPWLWDRLMGAWLPFLGPSGLKLFDISGHKNNGTITSMPFVPSPLQRGYVIEGNTLSNRVGLGDIGILRNQQNFTLSTDLYFSDIGVDSDIFVIGAHKLGEPLVFWMDFFTPVRFGFLMEDSGVKYSAFSPKINVRYSISFVYCGSGSDGTVRLFINGMEDALSPFTLFDSSMTESGSYTIGNGLPFSKGIRGSISSVILHTRALSCQEIQQLYVDPRALVRRKPQIVPYVSGGAPAIHSGPLVNGPILKSKFRGLAA